jgi:hypothetical protein
MDSWRPRYHMPVWLPLRVGFFTVLRASLQKLTAAESRFTAVLRDAAADDGDLCAVRCRLGISSLIPWLGTGKSSGTHARALTPACCMPASGSASFVILLESYGVSAGNSAPLPDSTC